MKNLISTTTLFVSSGWSIDQALKSMIKCRVSSALVFDDSEEIVGIVTERDILRKISLLDLDRKLARKINTIMSRPVEFAFFSTIDEDVQRMHREMSLRHFPVLKKKGAATKRNVAGIITVTDIARKYMDDICGQTTYDNNSY